MVTALFSVNITTVSAYTGTQYDYSETDGKITITRCYQFVTEIQIPSNINGVAVTTIGENAFRNCKNIKSVILPDSIISICRNAFSGCNSLTNITIPNSVMSIGEYAFTECSNLNSVILSNKLVSIGGAVFHGCSSLTNIIIPDSVKTIGDRAFAYCNSLIIVTIPDSVTSIGEGAFYCSDNISEVYYDGIDEEWENISIGDGNEALKKATRKLGYDIKLITKDGSEQSIICFPGKKIKLPDIEKKYMHKVTLYTDSAMKNEFDISTVITDNMTLYVKLGKEIQGTKTTVSEDGTAFTIKPINIDEDNVVILALYNGDTLVETQSKPYTGEDIAFTTGKAYTAAKVMVWNNLESMTPICDVELVK